MAKSFQKKVLDNDLWIDQMRLLWVRKMGEKKFRTKNYYSAKSPTVQEISDIVRQRLFQQSYHQIVFELLSWNEGYNDVKRELAEGKDPSDFAKLTGVTELLSEEDILNLDSLLEKHWPNQLTYDKLQKIFAKCIKATDEESYKKEVNKLDIIGHNYQLRKAYSPYLPYGGPKPELLTPIEDTAAIISLHAEKLNRLQHTDPGPYHPIELHAIRHLHDLEKAMIYAIATQLVLGDTNIFLIDNEIIYSLINMERDRHIRYDDLQQLPFDEFYIEFDKPVTLGKNFESIAMGVYSHPNAYTIIFYSNHVGGIFTAVEKTETGEFIKSHRKVPLKAPPYLDILGIHICKNGTFQVKDVNEEYEIENYIGQSIPPNYDHDSEYIEESLDDQLLRITYNVLRFLVCRNINYDKQRRPPLKPNPAIHGYTHKQGQQANLARDYRHIKINREVRPYGTGHKATELAFRVHMPAVIRRLVYCKECGDLHRHDLKGQPCRKCGKTVGPHKNIDIHEIYIPDYWKGPEDAPTQQHARHLTQK